jgi:uncharacterized protein YjbJ (UPF0337 family)
MERATKDIWQGRWTQLRGKIREKWGELTQDELDQAKGQRDQLVGRIQEKTGKARAEIEKEIDRMDRELRK